MQGCKECETEGYPIFLWVNTPRDDDDDEEDSEDEDKYAKPHDRGRCEACHGVYLLLKNFSA